MNRMLESLPPATVISVNRGAYRHVGLLTELCPGQARKVISLNPGLAGSQLVEEFVSTFARNQEVTVEGLSGTLPWWQVLARARSGAHPAYSWTQFNCEHFVRFAHQLPAASPQVRAWGAIAATVLFVAFQGKVAA
ncbi:hypothetical protein [Piscinibacter terrae]|nr:hypothetical protein [Albitalea terrae]